MENLKISVITTVLNEADTIHSLIESLLNQTRPPDELIVVDAGSTDQTPKIVHDHQRSARFPIQFIASPGSNRSQGRNIAIAAALYEHIAVIDAGCEADHHWLEHIADKFSEGYEAVAGYYLPSVDKPVQQLIIPFVAVTPNQFDKETFLPSSRSLGFTKKAWELVGKYPEHLPTCEDLIFAARLKTHASMIVEPKALVYWHMVSTLPQFFHQVSGYAQGDVLAVYRPHIYSILTMWLRYVLFILFPPTILFYIAYKAWKHRHYIKLWQHIPWYIVILITADIAVIWGSLIGWFQLMSGFRQNSIRKEQT